MAEESTKTVVEEDNSLEGDILESIFFHVPLPDLVPARHVSKSWDRGVSATLRYSNPPKPWLLLHKQSPRPPYKVSSHAYDPRSHVWIDVSHVREAGPPPPPAVPDAATLRSSHSTLLYTLTPSRLSLSFDVLHLTWRHVNSPLTWRVDPVVAVVGAKQVVVAGGACDFEDDPLAVEVYDLEAGRWDRCQSMPAGLKDRTSSTWLSVAAIGDRMLVADKSTGAAHAFDPRARSWSGPYRVCPEGSSLRCCLVGESGGRLISVGVVGSSDDRERISGVKLWELDDRLFGVRREIGEMPGDLVAKLGGEWVSFDVLSSMSVCFVGDWVYLVHSAVAEEVFFCEMIASGACRWGCVPNDVVARDHSLLNERLVFTCSYVGLGDLEKAMVCGGRKFTVR